MYFSNHMYSVYESDITKAKGKQDVYLNIFNALDEKMDLLG